MTLPTHYISILLFSSLVLSGNLNADTKTNKNNSLQTSSQGFPVKWVTVNGKKIPTCTMPGYSVYQRGSRFRCFKLGPSPWLRYIATPSPSNMGEPPYPARIGSVNGRKQPICYKGYRVYKRKKIIPARYVCFRNDVSDQVYRNYTLYIYK